MAIEDRFLADGYQRGRAARETSRAAIRREVEQEFADRLRQAGFFSRLLIRRRIRREVERRLSKLAPPDALYLIGSVRSPR